ncbi:hypothetical protein ASPFODRAFT_317876 [Aspergillus luchuensis CBS 106.47]|uniref:Uncharacterized protein n=1 Tax=Aspergillus luchuensis (strain CBS 106.47) TaxID=1137211 RepID=A0A1M3T9G6_ASPLC|nr:hypothetical protein ASPFODRAFT_317876 [Aspergillus luchuensis CBS 106.47]
MQKRTYSVRYPRWDEWWKMASYACLTVDKSISIVKKNNLPSKQFARARIHRFVFVFVLSWLGYFII